MKYNIFGSNEALNVQVAKSLEFPELEDKRFGWFTSEIFLSTFFYLSKRFGSPEIHDEYKLAGTWDFEVGQFMIRIEMNSDWVIFQVFGGPKYKNFLFFDPYQIKRIRQEKKHKHLIIEFKNQHSEEHSKIINTLFEEFKEKEGIDDSWTEERFKQEKFSDWINYIFEYNSKIIGINAEEFIEKHGRIYSNSNTRYALKILDKFLKNMLTPIWIRDVPYNIKGRCSDKAYYAKYENNIEFKYITSKS